MSLTKYTVLHKGKVLHKNLTEEETWVSLNRANEYGAVTGLANDPLTYSLEVQYFF